MTAWIKLIQPCDQQSYLNLHSHSVLYPYITSYFYHYSYSLFLLPQQKCKKLNFFGTTEFSPTKSDWKSKCKKYVWIYLLLDILFNSIIIIYYRIYYSSFYLTENAMHQWYTGCNVRYCADTLNRRPGLLLHKVLEHTDWYIGMCSSQYPLEVQEKRRIVAREWW